MRFPFRIRQAVIAALFGVLLAANVSPGVAASFKLAPNTKVQVTIVQWNPSKAEYQRWDALGGTFVVSPDMTLALPILGSVDVTDRSGADIAGHIALALKEKVGLLSAPEVTVEVVEYPPIYVVGAVNQPGEYAYRPGLTVLQALALSGGRYRTAEPGGKDVLSLAGELDILRADELRLIGRIARLDAELAETAEITFPPQLTANPNRSLVEQIVNIETLIFSARENETDRQLATLSELNDLYDQELSTLQARAEAGDRSVALAQKQLDGVTELYRKGVSTLSRQADLERVVAGLQVERLVDDTEMMKVRQNKSENRRQELNVQDQRKTNLSLELRDARAELDRVKSRQFTVESLLMEVSGGAAPVETSAEAELVYAIVRHEAGEPVARQASESTYLEPGDVVKVEPAGRPSETEPGSLLSGAPSTGTRSGQTSGGPVPLPKPRPAGTS
ncbi:SLBB domain-containing protein [Microbaculum sp. FT89]|uniref:polysaccharide biosynthesis/export family protein n=1 Tax=Microbaculum sp. FT89 TaxID=3447298 RepID=UPI003F53860C